MIWGAKIIPRTVTTDRTTRVNVSTRRPTSHAASRPYLFRHSTNTGTKIDVRIPPRISS